MKYLHFDNSYKIWSLSKIRNKIDNVALEKYSSIFSAEVILDRSYMSMYLEWWLHNIVYYVTKPFSFIKFIKKINLECKDIDLAEQV